MEPSTRCFRKQPRDARTERISWRTVQRRLVRKNFANGCRTWHSGNRRRLMQYHDHHESDSCPQKQDPADWYASSYTRHPVEDLEPLNEEPNSYRKAALGYLLILLAVDSYMARSKDGVMAWVSIAIVLRLHSVKGLTTANIASQLGCTESQLERSCSRFKRLLPADGVPRDVRHSGNGNGANHSTNGSER